MLSIELPPVQTGTVHLWHIPLAGTTARGWTRRILSRYLDCNPEEISFTYGEHGKPRIEAGVDLEFNLSHAGELALLAVTRGRRVGVDIERWDRPVDHLAVARRFFSAAEQEAILAVAQEPAELCAAFFACWSRKEAYLKATGEGLSRGLSTFDVTVSPGAPARLLADRRDPDATGRWRLVEVSVPERYSGALVAEAPLDDVFVNPIDITTFA